MEITILTPAAPQLLLPIILLGLSIPLLIVAFSFLDAKNKFKKSVGFTTAFGGIALLACGLIPLLSQLGGGDQVEEYRVHIYEDHGLKLEDHSPLAVGLTKVEESKISVITNVVIAGSCEGTEVVKKLNLYVTRTEKVFTVYAEDGKLFNFCEKSSVPTIRKMDAHG